MPLQQKKAATLQVNSQRKKPKQLPTAVKKHSCSLVHMQTAPVQTHNVAKLAILGVSSKVVESQNGDKTIYRVQSNTMPQEAAVKLQKNLQGHNINSLIRSSK